MENTAATPQKKTVGAFWLREKKDRDGNTITVLSGTVDLGVSSVNIVPNKYKKPGETKPDYYAYPATGVAARSSQSPRPQATEDVPF